MQLLITCNYLCVTQIPHLRMGKLPAYVILNFNNLSSHSQSEDRKWRTKARQFKFLSFRPATNPHHELFRTIFQLIDDTLQFLLSNSANYCHHPCSKSLQTMCLQ